MKGEVYKALANVLAEQEPIVSSANKVFPTVDSLPGGAFQPKGVSVLLNKQIRTSVDGTVILPPGDYTIPVDVFCMKHSASSPSGHRYLLARLKGKMADVITALNSRSVGSGISHQQLQVLSWNIQAGMKYEAMSPDNRAIIDKLLPDYKSRMSQGFLETVESQYNQFRFANLPSFNSALDRLGDVGNIVKQYRQFSSNLRQYGGDYNSLSRLLITSGESNARGGVNNTPWSKISDRVYGRMVTEGNATTPGKLQLRVLPEVTSSIYGKGVLVASNLTNTISQNEFSSQLMAAKSDSKVKVDITNLVADPQNSNIQPLSMSPSDDIIPRQGDIVIYRSGNGDITHSGVITAVLPDGTVTQIKSKWKNMGLYLHNPNYSIYGNSWSVWRANRKDGSTSNYLKKGRYRLYVGWYTDSAVRQDGSVDTNDLKDRVATYSVLGGMPADSEFRKSVEEYVRSHKIQIVEPPSRNYNCHGFTFINGEESIDDTVVEKILRDNGYSQLRAKDTDGNTH